MILSTHGFLASSGGVAIDADAQAFFDRVTTAGGSLTNTEKSAVNSLVVALKANSLWTPMKAIYPMVGASAAACAQNLKSSSFTGTFSSGWTFSSSGIKGNGTTTYMNTFLSPNGNISLNSGHLSYYTNENVKIGAFQIGVFGNNASTMLGARFDATRNYVGINATGDVVNSETNNVNSFVCLSRISSTEFKYYKQNTTYQTITNASNQLSNNNIYVGALNLDGTTAFLPDTARCAFASIGLGLTDTENSNLYTAVQAFQTTLSRQV
jgi:hypothetical protein